VRRPARRRGSLLQRTAKDSALQCFSTRPKKTRFPGPFIGNRAGGDGSKRCTAREFRSGELRFRA
jgi:hypothetical protein